MKKNIAETINHTCICKTLNRGLIEKHLHKEELDIRPNLFSSTMMFISRDDYQEMKTLINEIENVIARPAYQAEVLKQAPVSALTNHGPLGAFMGYDFHITQEGIKLIEINTNAGGGLLNAKLAQAQHACCVDIDFEGHAEEDFIQMFQNEWKLQKGSAPLKTIAIVDDKPEEQYLYPEFRLFEKMFRDNGIEAYIADPGELRFVNGKLLLREVRVDLVYNRLTDFYLQSDNHKVILDAYSSGEVVVTPNPHHHALYANKNNLQIIREFELSDVIQQGIPETIRMNPLLWEKRKDFFFKPASGYGSKASYRGDKITKKVWNEIVQADYVAQKIVPPGKRIVDVDGTGTDLKADIRAYVYQGNIQLLAARLYSGQTTNFRTAGGGFAPVFVTP